MEKQTLHIIKVGGNIIDDESRLRGFLEHFAALRGLKLLVHGGGKVATQLAKDLGIPQQMVDGRRITDKDTLRIVTMVYAGLINKQVVASLQGLGCNAIGLCGADAGLVLARKRAHAQTDYGFVGDVESIAAGTIDGLLQQGLSVVLAPITHDGRGQLLNTNADTIAQEIARGMSPHYHTVLVYSFEKPGVLMDAEDDSSVIPRIDPTLYRTLKDTGRIFAGMIPKLDNAFQALSSGVGKVIIGQAENLPALVDGKAGTAIVP
jgi:acetylglutamate kinase